MKNIRTKSDIHHISINIAVCRKSLAKEGPLKITDFSILFFYLQLHINNKCDKYKSIPQLKKYSNLTIC